MKRWPIYSLVVLVAVTVIYGTFCDIQIIRSILPPFIAMKLVTAVAFFAIGIGRLVEVIRPRTIEAYMVGMLCGLCATVVILSSLIAHATGTVAPLDVIAAKTPDIHNAVGPPAMGTTLAMFGAIAAMMVELFHLPKLAKHIDALVMFFGIGSMIGIAIGDPVVRWWSLGSTPMAPHTAVLFALLGSASWLVPSVPHKAQT